MKISTIAMNKNYRKDDVAITGISFRFPQSNSLEEFWGHLISGKSLIREVPQSRWKKEKYFSDSKDEPNKSNPIWCGFIDDQDCFDAAFFKISRREAELMDPQQRILLELAWKAIEDAGYNPDNLRSSKIGVFVGVCHADYRDIMEKSLTDIDGYTPTGIAYSILSNRISYWFDFKGPSITNDTACASSLTSIYEAVNAIKNKDCECALVAGVNLCLDAKHFIAFSKAGMLSKTGTASVFDEKANGYVRGEGAAVLLLKPLERAISDRDHVYAIIKGIGLNHGGKTNSLTITNPKAQAELISDLYEKEGISPETVTYIEAHGTGTPLGDPIEIHGLKTAFESLSRKFRKKLKSNSCGIGSVKSNIGHLEAAAGMAGIIKVLASMHYKMLPANINFEKLNPVINLENSPFYVVSQTKPWDISSRTVRRAGVSSFGFGGCNTHLILDEYDCNRSHAEKRQDVLIPISAKNQAILYQIANNLLTYLEKMSSGDVSNKNEVEGVSKKIFEQLDIEDIAFTLQLGRKAMDERAIFLVKNTRELIDKLEAFCQNNNKLKNYWQGNINSSHSGEFKKIEQKKINALLAVTDLAAIAQEWIRGTFSDWEILYNEAEDKPHRISLPTYPFLKDQYWIDKKDDAGQNRLRQHLHPMVHENVSTFDEQLFTSKFEGTESFLIDHVINNKNILPGVAAIEIVRAAIENSLGTANFKKIDIQLKNIIWISPIAIDLVPTKIFVKLAPLSKTEISYIIFTENVESQRVVHNQGKAFIIEKLREQKKIDLKKIRQEIETNLNVDKECYSLFNELGMTYGPSHRAITSIWIGEDSTLVELKMPSILKNPEKYFLHPSMMDGAFQGSVAMALKKTNQSPFVPFTLHQLTIWCPTEPTMYALITYNNFGEQGKFDIDLCNSDGKICVEIKGLEQKSINKIDVKSSSINNSFCNEPSSDGEIVELVPVWDPTGVQIAPPHGPEITGETVFVGLKECWEIFKTFYPKAHSILIEKTYGIEDFAEKLKQFGVIANIVWCTAGKAASLDDDDIIAAQERGVINLFRFIKALVSIGYAVKKLSVNIITIKSNYVQRGEKINPIDASLSGLIGSAIKEFPGWRASIFDLNSLQDVSNILALSISYSQKNYHLSFRNGTWYSQKLIPVKQQQNMNSIFKNRGVYVVIGGAGGIGEVFSEYLIQNYQASIVWIGRRPIDSAIDAKIQKLAKIGIAPWYICADARNRDALDSAYKQIKEKYLKINGVVHSAIVLEDKGLVRMTEEQFRNGLSAKIDVCVRMAQVFKREILDFLLFFSSIESYTQAAGQSNYAAGCTFKDAFAKKLLQECNCAIKVVNWGYWGSVGVVASRVYQRKMAKEGLCSIEPIEAMNSLETFMSGSFDQLTIAKTIIR